MLKHISKDLENDLLKLGIYQLAGGGIGLLIGIWAVWTAAPFRIEYLFPLFVIMVSFGYSIFCGLLCLKFSKSCFRHSLINQMLQLVHFVIYGFGLQYASGFFISLGVDLADDIKFDFGVGLSKVQINLNAGAELFNFKINIISLGIIIWISQVLHQLKVESQHRSVSELVE